MFLRTIRKFVEEGEMLFTQVQDVNRQTRNANRGNGKELTKAEKNYNFYSFADQTINLIGYAYDLKRQLVVSDTMTKTDKFYVQYVGVIRNLNI